MRLILNIKFLKFYCLLFVSTLAFNAQAQCPSPTATAPPINASIPGSGATTIGGVTYVTGSISLGNTSNAYTVTIPGGATLVISAGSHLSVQNMNVNGTLIIQDGATVSIGTIVGGGSMSVSTGGVVQMCTSSGLEVCGTTTLSATPSLTYVGSSTGKAVAKFSNYPNYGGTLTMPYGSGASNSTNITIAAGPALIGPSYLFNVNGSAGVSPVCSNFNNCTGLPFNTALDCGGFFGQTAVGLCTAGTVAPALSAITKANTCPTTTVDLTTITATNLPSGTTLTWHTGTPATTANKVTGTAVAAGTYYAAFFDATNNCYSGTAGSATTAVTATASNICLGTPSTQIAATGQAKSGNVATELTPTGGTTMPYVYSNGSSDPACIAPSGATALPPTSNLTVTSSTGAYTYTAPSTAGTYYFCIKVCDSATPTANCNVANYTVTVTQSCNAGSTAPVLTKN